MPRLRAAAVFSACSSARLCEARLTTSAAHSAASAWRSDRTGWMTFRLGAWVMTLPFRLRQLALGEQRGAQKPMSVLVFRGAAAGTIPAFPGVFAGFLWLAGSCPGRRCALGLSALFGR